MRLEKVLICVVALLVVGLIACGDDDGDEAESGRAEPKLVTGTPKPGVEYTATFRPRVVMRFPDPGWEVLRDTKVYASFFRPAESGQTPHISQIQPLSFIHPVEVYDPRRPDTLVRGPADIEAWLREHPAVDASRAEQVTVGGERAVRFEIRGPKNGRYLEQCADRPCKRLFYTAAIQVFAIQPGATIELTLVDVGGETVVIAVDPAFREKAYRVIETLRFG
jgi:hypothetical protein